MLPCSAIFVSTATQQEGSGVLHTLPGLWQGLHWGNRQDITCMPKRTQEASHKQIHRRLSSSCPCTPTTLRHRLREHLSSGLWWWLFQEESKGGTTNKTDNFNQDSQPSMVITFVKFLFQAF